MMVIVYPNFACVDVLCVGMCVCVHACMHACVHAFVRACMYEGVCVCVCVCVSDFCFLHFSGYLLEPPSC